MSRVGIKTARRAVFLVALAVILVLSIGCRRSTIGQPCRELGRASCVDPSHVLVCRGYSWHLDSCRGPRACTGAEGRAECDASVAVEGDPCGVRGKTSCTEDGRGMLECNGTTAVLVSTCRGPDACRPGPLGARCDTSVAREGDPCASRGPADRATANMASVSNRVGVSTEVASCTIEGDAELLCVDGVYKLRTRCRGPKGCRAREHEVVCDRSVAEEGERCDLQHEVCSVGGRSMLRCSSTCGGGRYVVESTCRGEGGCVRRPFGGIDCDDGVGEVGDPCAVVGGSACTPDKKKLLRCGAPSRQNGRGYAPFPGGHLVFAVSESCPRECRITRTPDGNGARISVLCR